MPFNVMAVLVTAIQVQCIQQPCLWMAGSSPAMQ